MVDLTKLITTAQRLISENGRDVTLVSLSSTPGDVSKPWQGPSNPQATPASTLDLQAVFVPPGQSASMGLSLVPEDLLTRSEQVALVAPGAAVDLTIYDELLDGTTRWGLVFKSVLRPGGSTILGFLGCGR